MMTDYSKVKDICTVYILLKYIYKWVDNLKKNFLMELIWECKDFQFRALQTFSREACASRAYLVITPWFYRINKVANKVSSIGSGQELYPFITKMTNYIDDLIKKWGEEEQKCIPECVASWKLLVHLHIFFMLHSRL